MLSQKYSNDERQNKKKRFLRELYDFPENVYPVGRLDEKSEGLLLLTSDGVMSNEICQSGVEKEYYAQLTGDITQEAVDQLCEGVEIGFDGQKYITKPAIVSKLDEEPSLPEHHYKIRVGMHGKPNSWIRVIIKEGKYRQVRKMTSAVGFPTIRLVRVRIGNIHLADMQPGDVIPLDYFDV